MSNHFPSKDLIHLPIDSQPFMVVFRVPVLISEAKAKFLGIPNEKHVENPGGDYYRGKGVTTQVSRYDCINFE